MDPWNNQSAKYFSFSRFNHTFESKDTTLYFKQFRGGGGYLVANINDLMGLITPLYLLAPKEKVNSHRLYLDFEWVEK
jgi:hypothetical protein